MLFRSKAMQSLGLEVYDAQGNIRPLNETFADLQAALSAMTQGEQTQALSKIFNKEDLKSVNALLANTGERFDELSGYIGNAAGAAENMANTQLDNLAGDVTLFKSALEGAQIILSDQLTPNLREFVQFGSDGVSKIASAFQEGGLSGAMEAFGDVLSDGLNMVVEQLPAMVDAGMQLLGALGRGIIENLPTITNAALEIIMTLINGAIEALPEIISVAVEIISVLVSGISESLPELIPVAVDAILQIVETLIDNVDKLVDAAIEIIVALADGLIEAMPKLLEKAPVIIEKLVTAIANNLPKIIQAGLDLIVKFAAGIIQNIPEAVKAVPKIITSIVTGFTTYMSKIKDVGKNIVKGLWDGILAMGSWIKEKVSGFFGGIVDNVKGLLGIHSPSTVFSAIGENISRGLANGIQAESGLAVSAVQKAARQISGVNVGGPNLEALPSLSVQQLPRVAQGTVIPASPQFSATVNRRSDTGNIAEQFSAIMQALQRTPESQTINITIETKLDGKVVARNTVKHINDMTIQAGRPVLLI